MVSLFYMLKNLKDIFKYFKKLREQKIFKYRNSKHFYIIVKQDT